MNRTTFKQFLTEEIDTQVFELTVAPPDPKSETEMISKLVNCGLLYDKKKGLLIGLKSDMWALFKESPRNSYRLGIASAISTPGMLKAAAKPAHDYVAELYTCQRPNDTLHQHIEDTSKPLPYGVSLAGRNKNDPKLYNCYFIHLKSVSMKDLPFIKLEKYVSVNWWEGTKVKYGTPEYEKESKRIEAARRKHVENFYVTDFTDLKADELGYETNPDYKYLDDHFVEVTTPKQLKGGTLQFSLGHYHSDLLIYLKNGYVRLVPKNGGQLRMMHSPKGDTPEERMNAAFEFAVKWVKKNV